MSSKTANPSDDPKPRILIVEDNPINVIVLKKFIEHVCIPDSVTAGSKALQMLEEKDYDLVLMDINLGDDNMNGVDVLHKIRESEKNKYLPVIAVTAYTMAGDIERFMEDGFIDFVPKPINKEEILKIIDKYLPSKRV